MSGSPTAFENDARASESTVSETGDCGTANSGLRLSRAPLRFPVGADRLPHLPSLRWLPKKDDQIPRSGPSPESGGAAHSSLATRLWSPAQGRAAALQLGER